MNAPAVTTPAASPAATFSHKNTYRYTESARVLLQIRPDGAGPRGAKAQPACDPASLEISDGQITLTYTPPKASQPVAETLDLQAGKACYDLVRSRYALELPSGKWLAFSPVDLTVQAEQKLVQALQRLYGSRLDSAELPRRRGLGKLLFFLP